MDMQLLSKKGFLLIDSLISVFVTSLLCICCYAIYQSMVNYNDGYVEYQNKSNTRLEHIYTDLYNCEVCQIDESD